MASSFISLEFCNCYFSIVANAQGCLTLTKILLWGGRSVRGSGGAMCLGCGHEPVKHACLCLPCPSSRLRCEFWDGPSHWSGEEDSRDTPLDVHKQSELVSIPVVLLLISRLNLLMCSSSKHNAYLIGVFFSLVMSQIQFIFLHTNCQWVFVKLYLARLIAATLPVCVLLADAMDINSFSAVIEFVFVHWSVIQFCLLP